MKVLRCAHCHGQLELCYVADNERLFQEVRCLLCTTTILSSYPYKDFAEQRKWLADLKASRKGA